MRTTTQLMEMEDIVLLWQYLYLSEEHSVTVKNTLGVPLEVTMDENQDVWVKNLNFPDVPAHKDTLSIRTWLGIIEQLAEQPLKEMAGWNVPERIKTRWDEIRELTRANLARNRR